MTDSGREPDQPPPSRVPSVSGSSVVIKKYANRRLYNTESSSYITLDTLAEMVRAGRDFVVYDARTGDDITRSVLTQIIVEEENKGSALLPTTFLRQLIGFYGDSLGGVLPRYLEQTMAIVTRQQEHLRDAVQQTMGSLLPSKLDELRRQNMAMMERAMSLFTPFYAVRDGHGVDATTSTESVAAPSQVEELKIEVARLKALLSEAQQRRGE